VRVARFRATARGTRGDDARTGIVDGDDVVDLGDVDLLSVLAEPDAAVGAADGQRFPLEDVALLAPVPRPGKLLAIGINYADHIAETGATAPEFPVFFNKQTTCVTGPSDPIHVPRVSDQVDYEGELGIVIGRRCRHVPKDRAHEVIGGYLVVDDVTVRDWQKRTPTWTLGKSFDTHGPTGPWVVTPDEVGDPHALGLRTWVSDELLQDASTAEMIFDCYDQIATLSTVCTLEPGDIISTGTPAGVGFTRTPPRYLVPGDRVRIEIENVGTIDNPVIVEPDDTPFIGAPAGEMP
jgi:2-keto-4-pentenoate hydratase/2-oxohepta-3-ene-1,7-dioic acid hydratase in catechol pathway